MSACTAESPDDDADKAATEALMAACSPPTFEVDETVELVPGLEATLLERGYGRRAIAGDRVGVHYTGWLFEPNAPDGKGSKFDSSVDRDEVFEFPLGAGRVIRGWDQGVECMLIGEKRLLKIAPELAYGARGAGGVIPPNATLLFEVKLLSARGPGE
jgi:FKBP-type peptidyl-prolyl cis-trans isomerase